MNNTLKFIANFCRSKEHAEMAKGAHHVFILAFVVGISSAVMRLSPRLLCLWAINWSWLIMATNELEMALTQAETKTHTRPRHNAYRAVRTSCITSYLDIC